MIAIHLRVLVSPCKDTHDPGVDNRDASGFTSAMVRML